MENKPPKSGFMHKDMLYACLVTHNVLRHYTLTTVSTMKASTYLLWSVYIDVFI